MSIKWNLQSANLFDCMKKKKKKAGAVFKLNTAWSLKYMYRMSTTSLFIALLHHLMSNKHDAQECHLCCPMSESKRKIYDKESTLISTGGLFLLVWLPESIGKVYQCSFDRISNPLGIKLYPYPLPLLKFTSFRPPYPSEFPWSSV